MRNVHDGHGAASAREGDVLRCTADWMGRWEVGVKLEKGAIPVTVFRHAIADIRKA